MKNWLFRFGLIAALLYPVLQANAQIQIGTIRGLVTDSSGSRVQGARLSLLNLITGDRNKIAAGDSGEFVFNNVGYANYLLSVEADGFKLESKRINVQSNIEIRVEFRLSPGTISDQITTKGQEDLINPDSSSTQNQLSETFIRRAAGATRSLTLQRLIATTPGFTTQNNGLLHIRGVDDGILYVIDGIPMVDRIDAISAGNFDTDMIRSLNIITGNIPAEFGGRSGAVVQIQSRSGIDTPFMAGVSLSAGSFRSREVSADIGAALNRNFGIFFAGSTSISERYLDPVDIDNLNNRGGTAKLNFRGDWHPSERDIVLLDVSANGSDFQVPNQLEQHLAGQRQRQELRDNGQSISWQKIWSPSAVSNFAWYRRSYESILAGSSFDTPIFANQDRRHSRQGLIAALTLERGSHTIKTGIEYSRVSPREFFSFAITDEEEAEENEISDAALEFTPDNPFIFSSRATGDNFSWYLQDNFNLFRNLRVNAGLRYDRSNLPVSEDQLSPRLGFAYTIPSTRTVLRASYNRLFMPPQVENLLLANSDQARELSPFFAETRGGAEIHPEQVSAYEVGIAQDMKGLFRLDISFWHRNFRNFDDPNVFFNTTIIFPNSVEKGFARGLDVRIDLPLKNGLSSFLSYTNGRIEQTGPINGGLFLTDEFIEIGPGTPFIPDHDQRNVGAIGLGYQRGNWWTSISGRYESGVPLEVEEERLIELQNERGAELVNFERRRIRPWAVFDWSAGINILDKDRVTISAQLDVQNFTDKQFAYNFGNPFEGTHFGYPRIFAGRLKFSFR